VGEPPAEGSLLEIELDGQPLVWPVVVDAVAGRLIIAFHGDVAAARGVVLVNEVVMKPTDVKPR